MFKSVGIKHRFCFHRKHVAIGECFGFEALILSMNSNLFFGLCAIFVMIFALYFSSTASSAISAKCVTPFVNQVSDFYCILKFGNILLH